MELAWELGLTLPVLVAAAIPLVLAPRSIMSFVVFLMSSPVWYSWVRLEGGVVVGDPWWPVASVGGVSIVVLLPLAPALFPDGRLDVRRTWVKVVAGVVCGTGVLVLALHSLLPKPVHMALGAALLLLPLLLMGDLVHRYRTELDATARRQVHWLILGIAPTVAFLLMSFLWGVVSPLLGGSKPHYRIVGIVEQVNLTWLALALANAVLRHRLWSLPVAVRSGAVLGIVGGAFLPVEFAIDAVMQMVLQDAFEALGVMSKPLVWGITTLVVGAIIPSARRLSRRWIYPEELEARKVFTQANQALVQCGSVDSLVDHGTRLVRKAWSPQGELLGPARLKDVVSTLQLDTLARGERVELLAEDPRHVGPLLVPVVDHGGALQAAVLLPAARSMAGVQRHRARHHGQLAGAARDLAGP